VETFNGPERAALLWIIDNQGDGSDIGAQLATARLISRRNTGKDFYTVFAVKPDPRHRLAPRALIGDACAHVRGFARGMTFLLWGNEDGYLVALEGAGFGEDISGLDFDKAQIVPYPRPAPDLQDFEPPPPPWRLDRSAFRRSRNRFAAQSAWRLSWKGG
jgi:hypothetical protein